MDEPTSFAVDDTDLRILRELDTDARASDVNLGDRVHLSSTAAARRRKTLEERGVIAGYTAKIDISALGYGIVVFVAVGLSSQAEQALIEFETAVVNCPSMSFCGFVTGDNDFVMIVHARSVDDYNRIYRSAVARVAVNDLGRGDGFGGWHLGTRRLVFGRYPVRRAPLLDPIDALRTK